MMQAVHPRLEPKNNLNFFPEDFNNQKPHVFYPQKSWSEGFFSEENYRKLWCCIGIGVIILGIYLTTIFSLFYFASREYNDLFLRVLDLEAEIRDQTTVAIQNFNKAADSMNSFSYEHPEMMSNIEQSLKFVSQFSNLVNANQTVSDMNDISGKVINLLDELKTFIEENRHYTNDIGDLITNGKNFTVGIGHIIENGQHFTDFLTEFKNKFTHW